MGLRSEALLVVHWAKTCPTLAMGLGVGLEEGLGLWSGLRLRLGLRPTFGTATLCALKLMAKKYDWMGKILHIDIDGGTVFRKDGLYRPDVCQKKS